MVGLSIAVMLALLAAATLLVLIGAERARRGQIARLGNDTVLDDHGAVRSVQAADIVIRIDDLETIWSPLHLERLARTYWRFLTRCTLGLVRVVYTPAERFVVLIARPFVLIRFQAPEYEMNAGRGIVRWRIEDGLLVAKRGKGGAGYLQIDVRRDDLEEVGYSIVHVEVEVANFYPAIASRISTVVYKATQSRIHVLVTNGFLRSLVRLDLARSRVGRFEQQSIEDVPDPPAATARAVATPPATPTERARP